jgi:divalent metal cation (Fe/Co/Zn/Cd) transporter
VLIDDYEIDPVELKSIIKTVTDVIKVYRVRSRWIGNTRAVNLVISVDSTLSTEESHDIADKIETLLENHFGKTDISIHVESESR